MGVGDWTVGSSTATRLVIVVLSVACGACRQDMHDAPRYDPLEASAFFADGRSARGLVANAVARGTLREDEHLYQGTIDGQLTDMFPMPVTAELMARGRERFNVFCSPCHGRTGQGNGMVVQRGFRAPPSFHQERLRSAPVGYYVNVETNGFGAMSDYSAQVPPEDRWAIAAYIRALQFSQRATVGDVPPDRRPELDRAPEAAPAAPEAR
ncbi:MAG: quinol:cytochrome C oxidoreductase [Acidobacteria bacterium RIFCSPLOWO2_02_FULL_68_18]|nr:MAG: quinol:cytochrome C oxidoreductase [Acidobacteria bacterium RIFCSPLOWO2_02_FULL_68_18]OFW49666.1 MAG: quinol:cytochrome C oxidoreductase [Acidobacteria bacterium RIFCSPLOWO2_12_FULL_68_19]